MGQVRTSLPSMVAWGLALLVIYALSIGPVAMIPNWLEFHESEHADVAFDFLGVVYWPVEILCEKFQWADSSIEWYVIRCVSMIAEVE